ncbi:uncharacterized protein BX664DRAFT_381838 [Halteromyces radiatus]|uniref:uncharacterized protein n=1 Tax=Halteromyces radiatus TaxID=101107 RepID=UPI00221FC098|nr:uncharacterized protein BX664DRAFT_389712 [Halteromyces radiatus]XP_051404831.1 uncharacterized protein BX664DRAFT_381838 [Halteromyces radiatus]KAI8075972.1 hypothetical protein BX664DRAFT_389712 [Halteromyces radiatus]KAI8099255.1 hypothetical protein BX664DRAFT_381838 [Halteromyces radiatus]
MFSSISLCYLVGLFLYVVFCICRYQDCRLYNQTNPSFYCIVIDTLTLAHDPRYQNSGLYSQLSDGHHYFILSFWSDEDHGVLIFVCLRAMDLVEDDQSLESFMNLVTEFCAQVGGGQNATHYCLYNNGGANIQGYNQGCKLYNQAKIVSLLRWNDSVRLPIEGSISNKIIIPKVEVMIIILEVALAGLGHGCGLSRTEMKFYYENTK